tara:strand:+ start:122 stop:415 length:294 start_codon:yes stop_codon:yes gene_type:complete
MNKILPVIIMLGLTACSASPEDQLKECAVNINKLMFKEFSGGMSEKQLAEANLQMEKLENMSLDEMKSDRSMGMSIKACMQNQKENPDKFQKILDAY